MQWENNIKHNGRTFVRQATSNLIMVTLKCDSRELKTYRDKSAMVHGADPGFYKNSINR